LGLHLGDSAPGGRTIWLLDSHPKPETGGQFGFGKTADGISWEALEPPEAGGVGGGEVGAIEKIGNGYYMMFCTGGIMVTLVADKPEGPFQAAKRNFRLLSGHTYFSRFFPTPDGLLVNHHSIARDGQVYFGTLKEAVVDNDGTLRLGWWKGNEKMKHEPVDLKLPLPGHSNGRDIMILENTLNVEQGVILEGTLVVPKGKNSPSNGLYIKCEEDQGPAILVGFDGVVDLGAMQADGSGFESEKHVDREISFGKQVSFRLLLQHSLLEFYLGGIMMECFSLPRKATGRIGLIQGSGQGAVRNIRAWRGVCLPAGA